LIVQYVKTEQPEAFISNGSLPAALPRDAAPPANVPVAPAKQAKPEK
jgi:hypothetical protein